MHFIGLVFVDERCDNLEFKLEPFDEQTENEQYLETDEEGYKYNPEAKYDWYCEGGRWQGYLYTKGGRALDCVPFDQVDWTKMFTKVDTTYEVFGKEVTRPISHHPYVLMDLDDNWHEDESDYLPFDSPEHEEMKAKWEKSVEDYVAEVSKMSDEDRAEILVYAIDFHI